MLKSSEIIKMISNSDPESGETIVVIRAVGNQGSHISTP